jgi:hypothetical protein
VAIYLLFPPPFLAVLWFELRALHVLGKHFALDSPLQQPPAFSRLGEVTQVVEYLPDKHEAPSSNPSTAAKRKQTKNYLQSSRSLQNMIAVQEAFRNCDFVFE